MLGIMHIFYETAQKLLSNTQTLTPYFSQDLEYSSGVYYPLILKAKKYPKIP